LYGEGRLFAERAADLAVDQLAVGVADLELGDGLTVFHGDPHGIVGGVDGGAGQQGGDEHGVTACILALSLHRLGRSDWKVYDGSWYEWAQRPEAPKIWAAGQ
jgi:hypothetical protein